MELYMEFLYGNNMEFLIKIFYHFLNHFLYQWLNFKISIAFNI